MVVMMTGCKWMYVVAACSRLVLCCEWGGRPHVDLVWFVADCEACGRLWQGDEVVGSAVAGVWVAAWQDVEGAAHDS